MTVCRIAHELGRFPHEVLALPVCEAELLIAYFKICDEVQKKNA